MLLMLVCNSAAESTETLIQFQMSLHRLAHRPLSTLTIYSPDIDQATALTEVLKIHSEVFFISVIWHNQYRRANISDGICK